MSADSRLETLGTAVGLLAVASAVAGPLAARLELLAPLAGFGLFVLGLAGGGLAALLLGLLALRRPRASRSRALAAVALGSVLLGGFAAMAVFASRYPRINDVTTRPDDAPAFQEAQTWSDPSRDLSYPQGSADVPRLQLEAYPDLAPIELAASPDAAFDAAQEVARALGWTITWSHTTAGVFEAEATTPVFRFFDDVVVRVRQRPGGSVVDVRSTSRVGRGDIGRNAWRIRTFAARLRARIR